MNTLRFLGSSRTPAGHPSPTHLPTAWALAGAWLACFLATSTHAAVPLPDHLLYGTIAIGGQPVTRADTAVVVEARRTSSGPVLASYRMGARPANGDFYYSLRIPVAKATDASPAQAALGESVVVTVRTATGIAHQVTHTVAEPGVALRLDFGVGVDTDGDGVPDGWELAHFGTSGGDLRKDTDGDGVVDQAEYFAGTTPKNLEDVLRLAVVHAEAGLQVSFRTLRATGTGFEGRTRYYALESTTDPAGGQWTPLENFSRIPAGDQLITYEAPKASEAPGFFRVRVWLE